MNIFPALAGAMIGGAVLGYGLELLALRPDVYKRQLSGRRFDWGGRLRKSNGGAQRFPQAGQKPVSYTHLDVYKRQM